MRIRRGFRAASRFLPLLFCGRFDAEYVEQEFRLPLSLGGLGGPGGGPGGVPGDGPGGVSDGPGGVSGVPGGGPGGDPGSGQFRFTRSSPGVPSRYRDRPHAIGVQPSQMDYMLGAVGGEETCRPIVPRRECGPRDPGLPRHDLVPIIDPVIAVDLCWVDRWSEPMHEVLRTTEMVSALARDKIPYDLWHPGAGEIPGVLAAVAAGPVKIQDLIQWT